MHQTLQDTTFSCNSDLSDKRNETSVTSGTVVLPSLIGVTFIVTILYILIFRKYKQAGRHSKSFHLSNGHAKDVEPERRSWPAPQALTESAHARQAGRRDEQKTSWRFYTLQRWVQCSPHLFFAGNLGACAKEENKEENCYINTSSYDHSRVHLMLAESISDFDYISVLFINGFQENNKFISTQDQRNSTEWVLEADQGTIPSHYHHGDQSTSVPNQGSWTLRKVLGPRNVIELLYYRVQNFIFSRWGICA